MKDLARQRYDEACAFDRSGREAEAIPCYEEALELGLPDVVRRQALLGLGSSYRNVLRHADAIGLLESAVAEYPDDAAFQHRHGSRPMRSAVRYCSSASHPASARPTQTPSRLPRSSRGSICRTRSGFVPSTRRWPGVSTEPSATAAPRARASTGRARP